MISVSPNMLMSICEPHICSENGSSGRSKKSPLIPKSLFLYATVSFRRSLVLNVPIDNLLVVNEDILISNHDLAPSRVDPAFL